LISSGNSLFRAWEDVAVRDDDAGKLFPVVIRMDGAYELIWN